MDIFSDSKQINLKLKDLSSKKKSIGFVPTMGALHEGHISLIKEAKNSSDIVIVSIFVNPKQFDRKGDLDSYPKQLDEDSKILESLNIDYLFVPKVEDIYKKEFYTKVLVTNLTNKLCGSSRTGHFDGVALIVTKLFNIIRPDIAFFGLKDYQQYYVIKKLSEDLNFNIDVRGVETVREKSGLALSSRNTNLSVRQREVIAPLLFEELVHLKDLVNDNQDIRASLDTIKNSLLQHGFSKIDYLEILNNDLSPYQGNPDKGRIFAAVFLDKVRLIDNIALV